MHFPNQFSDAFNEACKGYSIKGSYSIVRLARTRWNAVFHGSKICILSHLRVYPGPSSAQSKDRLVKRQSLVEYYA